MDSYDNTPLVKGSPTTKELGRTKGRDKEAEQKKGGGSGIHHPLNLLIST